MYSIFRCLGERAAMVREKLAELAKTPISEPASQTQATYLTSTATEEPLDALDEAMRKARVELGR